MRHATTLGGLALITLLANGPSAQVAAQTVTGSPAKEEVPKALAEAGVSGIAVDRLGRTVAALNHSVARKQGLRTMREANQVALDVADLTAAYKVSVPVEVTRLDYYGRELEIWAEVGTMARLKATASGRRHEWNAVRSRVEGKNRAEGEKFEALVARAERARTSKEYSPLASRVLDEVDHLESVFQR
jgi:hypothetical protein